MTWEHIVVVVLLALLLWALRPSSAGSAAVTSLGDATAAVALTGL